MDKKIGRNDPCPCGSGKKFKQCCWKKHQPGQIKFKAKWVNPSSAKKQEDLLERTFGQAVAAPAQEEKPPTPERSFVVSKNEDEKPPQPSEDNDKGAPE